MRFESSSWPAITIARNNGIAQLRQRNSAYPAVAMPSMTTVSVVPNAVATRIAAIEAGVIRGSVQLSTARST